MSTLTFNIPQMLRAVFGVLPPPVVLPGSQGGNVSGVVVPTSPAPVNVKLAALGGSTPIVRWQRLKFQAGSYKLTDGTKASMPDIYLPEATFVELYRNKIEVYTGRVVEHIEMDNWSGTIRGLITPGSMGGQFTHPHEYPYNDLAILNQLFTYCDVLPVVGDLFSELGIGRLNLSNLQLPVAEGFANVQPFSINFRSDEPVELVLKNNPNLKNL